MILNNLLCVCCIVFVIYNAANVSAIKCYFCASSSGGGVMQEGYDTDCEGNLQNVQTVDCDQGSCVAVGWTSTISLYGLFTSEAVYFERNCNIYDIPPNTCIEGPDFNEWIHEFLDGAESAEYPAYILDIINYDGQICACSNNNCLADGNHSNSEEKEVIEGSRQPPDTTNMGSGKSSRGSMNSQVSMMLLLTMIVFWFTLP